MMILYFKQIKLLKYWILDIRNIRDAIKDFNEDEKVITNSYTLGGEQECLFFNFIHVVLNYTNNSIIYLFIYLY